ncbi:hypothetical protein ACRAWF_39035 [Streptomyces sp. L7]
MTVDVGAAVGGVVVGALAVAAAPEVVTAAGAVLVAGVGVGAAIIGTDLLDHTFHEHWSEDIHDHGVVGGVAHGVWNVGAKTGEDVGRLGKDIWHGVTSIFLRLAPRERPPTSRPCRSSAGPGTSAVPSTGCAVSARLSSWSS